MYRRIMAAAVSAILIFCFTACKSEGQFLGGNQAEGTSNVTRIHNNFKDVLPSFKFDSDPVENYKEGISYSFSAECSDKKFENYVKKIKDSGFTLTAVEGEGYYAARNSDKFYVEITLVDEMITVFAKRV